jgi:hypothetical protein
MTEKVYPLETHLKLTEKAKAMLSALDDYDSKISHAIKRLDSLEKTLPMVARNYFKTGILLPMKAFGETTDEVDEFINQMVEDSLITTYLSGQS